MLVDSSTITVCPTIFTTTGRDGTTLIFEQHFPHEQSAMLERVIVPVIVFRIM